MPNIYDYLAHLQGGISGFSDTQLEEEKAKAQLRLARPEVNVLLDEIEDFFSGKSSTSSAKWLKRQRSTNGWSNLNGLI